MHTFHVILHIITLFSFILKKNSESQTITTDHGLLHLGMPVYMLGHAQSGMPNPYLGWINLWQARSAAWACPIGHAQVVPNLLVSVPLAWAVLWQAQVLPKLPNHESGKLLTGLGHQCSWHTRHYVRHTVYRTLGSAEISVQHGPYGFRFGQLMFCRGAATEFYWGWWIMDNVANKPPKYPQNWKNCEFKTLPFRIWGERIQF